MVNEETTITTASKEDPATTKATTRASADTKTNAQTIEIGTTRWSTSTTKVIKTTRTTGMIPMITDMITTGETTAEVAAEVEMTASTTTNIAIITPSMMIGIIQRMIGIRRTIGISTTTTETTTTRTISMARTGETLAITGKVNTATAMMTSTHEQSASMRERTEETTAMEEATRTSMVNMMIMVAVEITERVHIINRETAHTGGTNMMTDTMIEADGEEVPTVEMDEITVMTGIATEAMIEDAEMMVNGVQLKIKRRWTSYSRGSVTSWQNMALMTLIELWQLLGTRE